MEVYESALQYVREDSRASIVLNGLLADSRVNISVGASNKLIAEGGRLQTSASLTEEVFALKAQIDKIADDIDRGLLGLSALTDVLEDEVSKADLAAVQANVAELRRQLASAEGLAGAVLNDPDTRTEISQTLRDTRAAATAAQDEFGTLERKAKYSLRRVERAADRVETLLEGLDDPANTSLVAILFNDASGLEADFSRLADDTQEALGAGRVAFADIEAALAEITRAVDEREGSLGRLMADAKPLYHLKDPGALRRVNVVKGLVRWVISADVDKGKSEAVPRDALEPGDTGEANEASDTNEASDASPALESTLDPVDSEAPPESRDQDQDQDQGQDHETDADAPSQGS